MSRRQFCDASRHRPLRIEPLEDRRVLAGLVVTNNVDTIDGDTTSIAALVAAPGDDGISIREAIEAANNTPGADEITFDFGHDGPEVIQLTQGEMRITDELTISGAGPGLLTIDAQEQARIFNIDDPSVTNESFDVSFEGVTLTRGVTNIDSSQVQALGEGGAVRTAASGTKLFVNVHFTNNHTLGSSSRGGAVGGLKGMMVFEDCRIADNFTDGNYSNGGAIFGINVVIRNSIIENNHSSRAAGGAVNASSIEVFNSEFRQNTTYGYFQNGGAMDVGTAVIEDSLFTGNRTYGLGSDGGAIASEVSNTIKRSVFTSNQAEDQGGAIGTSKLGIEHVDILDSIFEDNSAVRGGAIDGYYVTIAQSTFRSNSAELGANLAADSLGGAVYSYSLNIESSELSGNYATEGGGAIYTLLEISVDGSHLIDNYSIAGDGGAIWARFAQISSSTISRNYTLGSGRGGGIYAESRLTLDDATISGNSARGDGASGGGIQARSLEARRSTITGNWVADGNGGGIQILDITPNSLSISNSIVSGNRASIGNDVHSAAILPAVNFSLIGSEVVVDEATSDNNIATDHPHLGPLADHGGPTLTHALLPTSPAINAGDPDFSLEETLYDQRGEGYPRVADGGNGLRVDIGAYESQGIPDYPLGDYNHDGIANLADYTVWRDSLGSTTNLAADGSGNNEIDSGDYAVWKQHFGNTTIRLTAVAPIEDALDAAFAMLLSPEEEPEVPSTLLQSIGVARSSSARNGPTVYRIDGCPRTDGEVLPGEITFLGSRLDGNSEDELPPGKSMGSNLRPDWVEFAEGSS